MDNQNPGPVAEKRLLILDAAIKVFANAGFHTSTMDQVAEAAGVAKGTLYLYFKSKNDLLDELIDMRTARLTSLMTKGVAQAHDLRARIRAIIDAHFEFYSTERDFMMLFASQLGLLSPKVSAKVMEGTASLTAMTVSVLAEGMAQGCLNVRTELDLSRMAFGLLGMVHAVAYHWIMVDGTTPAQELSAEVYSVFANGAFAAQLS